MAYTGLRIATYNSTGLACDRREFIRDFLNKNVPDVLFIQETWLLNANMGRLNEIHDAYIGNGVSGTPDDELLIGRPRGGVGILWKRTLSDSITFHTIQNTDRACALTIKTGTENILLINIYLPTDNQSKTRIDHSLLCTLDAVEIFIQQCDFRNVILAGDMNVDFTRQNAHDVYVKNYASVHDFICSVDLDVAEKGFTYHDANNGSFSCIDHFLVSSGLSECVQYVTRLDYHDNPSNHLPLLLELRLKNHFASIHNDNVNTDAESEKCDKPIAWHKVTDNHKVAYQHNQDRLLLNSSIPEVALCTNVNCCDPLHKSQIDEWFQDMVDCCILSDRHLPRIEQRKMNKPYWKAEVKPYRDESLWWHNLWLQCGEPKEGIIYEHKSDAKRQYMYAVRRYKKKEDQMRKERMAEAICKSNSRDFFREVKKLKPKRASAPSIDGLVSQKDISEHFAGKYDVLYNSVPSDSEKLSDIRDYIKESCVNFLESDRVITNCDITKALSQLKADKSDGNTSMMSTHLLMSSELYKSHLALLLTSMITHGHQPQTLLLATVTSIPKDNRGNLCDSSNYRGIALCSSISKVLDIIVLNRYGHLLNTSDMQYAYKRGHSTSMCTLTVKETVNYYLLNDSQVYSCCVDLSKAFDRVQHDMLFQLLIDRKMPALIVRVILDMYERQLMRIVWNRSHSHSFKTGNGVRQGGILSPVLFCIYMDTLLEKLETEGIGCWVRGYYYGAVGYADDLMLLSPSVQGLRKMLKVCESYGQLYGVKYNPKKTVCMLFSKQHSKSKPKMTLCGDELAWVDSVKHLGHVLTYNLSEAIDVRNKKCDMYSRVNTVLANLGKSCDSVLQKIFNSQCAHLYGTVVWSFDDKSIREYVVAWNRSVRRMFNLPAMTHTRFLPHILENPGVLDQIYCRFVRMCNSMLMSKNRRLKHLYNVCMSTPRSIIRRNLRQIEMRLNVPCDTVLSEGTVLLRNAYLCDVTDCDRTILNVICELREAATGKVIIPGFHVNEVCDFIYYLCTF